MKTNKARILIFIILFLGLALPSGRSNASNLSLQLYSGGDYQDGLEAGQTSNLIFYDETFEFSYFGGKVCLSSRSDSCKAWAIDDAVRLFIDGSQVYYKESNAQDMDPVEFSALVNTGVNHIRVQLIDLMDPNQGGSPLWLVPINNGQNVNGVGNNSDNTENWNTLENKFCGFSIKYPNSLATYGDPGEMGDLDATTSGGITISANPGDQYNSSYPSINIECGEKSLYVYSDWSLADISSADYEANQTNEYSPTKILEPLHEIKFAGEVAYAFSMNSNGYSGRWSSYMGYEGDKSVIEVEHNGIQFTIVYSSDPTIESVVSTFSFLDMPYSQSAFEPTVEDQPTATVEPYFPEPTETVSIDLPLPPDGFSGTKGFWCFLPDFCIDAATNVSCSPQCVATARANRKDLLIWGGVGTSDEILSVASQQPTFIFEGKKQLVRVRSQGEQPQAGDLVIWPSNCDYSWSGGGHIGYVTNSNPFRISDSNWGNPISDSQCATRTNVAIPIKSCMKFITAPYPEVTNQTGNSPTTSNCNKYNWLKRWFCERKWIK